MTEAPGVERLDRAVGLLALGLAILPIFHVLNGWADFNQYASAVLVILRYLLLAGIGLMVRHPVLRVLIVALAVLFLVLDVLAVVGVFSVYDNPFRQDEDFIYFQF